jgi:large subunit ribosomal protein L9
MEIILRKTIDTLGREGEVVKVKPGYARNYLIPQNMATLVTKGNLARLQKEQAVIAQRVQEEKKKAEELAGQLSQMTVVLSRKTGNEGRLFGSVTAADIADTIASLGITIDRRTIMLQEPIKSIGESKILIKVGYQMTAEVLVQVVPEGEGA